MNVLIVGGGGREHALAWRVAQSPQAEAVYVSPGNAGTALEPRLTNVPIDADDLDALVAFAREKAVGLTIVGPEAPLVIGIVDRFREAGLRVFGCRRRLKLGVGVANWSKIHETLPIVINKKR